MKTISNNMLQTDSGIPFRLLCNEGIIIKDDDKYVMILFDTLGKAYSIYNIHHYNNLTHVLEEAKIIDNTLAFANVVQYVDLTKAENFAKIELIFSMEQTDELMAELKKSLENNSTKLLNDLYLVCVEQSNTKTLN